VQLLIACGDRSVCHYDFSGDPNIYEAGVTFRLPPPEARSRPEEGLEDVKKLISERGAISAFKHFASG
jgi:hypothetical protein